MSIKLNRKGAGLAGEDRVKENQNLEMIEQEFAGLESVKTDSAAAKLSALEAMAKADAADSLSKNVQTQLNTIVVEGDSSPQAEQASVGARGEDYGGNLKARLDAEFNETATQLADNAHDFSTLARDGQADDAPAINAVIETASAKGVTSIKFPKGVYRINSPLYALEKDNVWLDFNGSDLLNYAKAANGSSLGIINFRGSMQGADLLTYLRSHLGTQLIPTDAPVLNSYEQYISRANAATAHYGGRITTSNNAYFSVGDDILIRGWTRSSGTNYNKDLYEPMMTVVAKVLKIEGGYVYIDYYNPYGNLIFNQGTMKSFCAKLTLAKNLKLSNVNIYDMTTVETTDGVSPTTNDRNEALTPVMFLGCENVEVENVKMFNFKGNGVRFWFSRDIRERNIEGYTPQLWDGGYGYTTQFNGSRDIEVDNIYGVENRHVIDFSFSSHAHVRGVKSLNGRYPDMDMHGQNEHDITWENVEGTVVFGNGIGLYPMMLKNIKFIDSKIVLPDLSPYNVRDEHWVENIIFGNCEIDFKHFMPFQSVEYRNSQLNWNALELSIAPNKRGRNIKTKSKTIDCELTIDLTDVVYTTIFLNSYDINKFENVEFIKINGSPTVVYALATSNSSNVILKDSLLGDFYVRMQCSALGDYKIHVDNCESRLKNAAAAFIRMEGLKGKLDVVFERSDLTHSGSVPIFYLISADTNSMTNGVIKAICRDNILKGNANAKIRSTHNTSAGKITSNNLYDSNNVIEHYEVNASNHISTSRNFIVS